MGVYVQVAAVLALVVIGFLTFRFNPLKLEIRSITFTAFMVMLSVVLSLLSIMIPLFGYPSLKIGLSQLPLMITGIFLGPSWAFVAGLIEDVLEVVIAPAGAPFFGFTLNKVLIAMIPALWMLLPKSKIKSFKYLPHLMLGVIYLTAMAFVVSINEVKVGKDTLQVLTSTKIGIFILSTLMVGFMVFMLNIIAKYFADRNYNFALTDWAISILWVELIVNLILTPFWLQVMYGIPFWLNVAPRLVKGTVMIQVNIVLGFILVNLVDKLMQGTRK